MQIARTLDYAPYMVRTRDSFAVLVYDLVAVRHVEIGWVDG